MDGPTPYWPWMETLYHRVILIRPDATQMGYGGSEHFAVIDVGYGLPVEQIALWPYPGQSGVPVSWNALEIPSPLRLYPGTEAPTGPVISMSTGGRVTSLATASLTGPDGTQVPMMRFTPENDELLVDSVAIIPYAPLQPGLTYQMELSGTRFTELGGERPFEQRWSFTMAPVDAAGGSLPVDPGVGDQEGSTPETGEQEPGDLGTPDTGAPDPGASDRETSDPGAPDLETPGVETPNLETPGPETPELETPGVEAPDLETPDLKSDAPENSPELPDIAGHWAEGSIRRLVELGIVGGYPDGSFHPDEGLTRGAFVKMLVAAQGLPLRTGDGGFADMGEHWLAQGGYLEAAVDYCIIRWEEYPEAEFNPEEEIGREEIAVMIVRALELEAEALQAGQMVDHAAIGGQLFSDAAAWTRPGLIAMAVEQGIVTGYQGEDGSYTFRPTQWAARAEAATMVGRWMRLS